MDDIYYKNTGIRIINNDILKTKTIPDNSIDLIVTSPPYNLDIGYESYNDGLDYQEYLKLCSKWFKRLWELAKPDGRFCLNIPLDKSKGGYQSVGADLTCIAKKSGWKYKTTIIWNEGNISKGSAWGSWLSASAPHIIAPVELIVVFYKENWKKTSGSKITTITPEEFKEWTRGMWTFKGESKRKIGHPAPFPVELPYRCIKLLSYEGDIVLDPFMGSGSTMVAAQLTKRRGIGVDIEPNYCEIAKNRIINETTQA
jgi:site-specific DNA-methyltransferase (adenine-specific)